MFESVQLLLQQMARMVIFILIGFSLGKGKVITEKTSSAISNLLIYAILPCTILNSFFIERTPETIRVVLYSLFGGALAMGATMLISALFLRKDPIEHFGGTIANTAFMAMPLVNSVLGQGATIYVSGFFFVQTIVMWTYNILFMRPKDEKPNYKSLYASPVSISLILGFLVFFAGLPMPKIISDCAATVAACNSPIAMIMLGIYISKTKFADIFTTPRIYWVSAIRLIIVPIAVILVLFIVPKDMTALRIGILIGASAPAAINTAVFPEKAGLNYTYGVKIICLSTIFSIFTLPLMTFVANLIW